MRTAIVFAFVILGSLFISPKAGECRFCPSFPCYGPCGTGCICLRQGVNAGACYGADLAPRMVEAGWSVVEESR